MAFASSRTGPYPASHSRHTSCSGRWRRQHQLLGFRGVRECLLDQEFYGNAETRRSHEFHPPQQRFRPNGHGDQEPRPIDPTEGDSRCGADGRTLGRRGDHRHGRKRFSTVRNSRQQRGSSPGYDGCSIRNLLDGRRLVLLLLDLLTSDLPVGRTCPVLRDAERRMWRSCPPEPDQRSQGLATVQSVGKSQPMWRGVGVTRR
jgi:hypothetical protein